MKNTKTIRYKETVYTNFFPPLKSKNQEEINNNNNNKKWNINSRAYILSFSHDAINARKKKFQSFIPEGAPTRTKREIRIIEAWDRAASGEHVSLPLSAPCVRDFELLSLSLSVRVIRFSTIVDLVENLSNKQAMGNIRGG